MTIQFTKFTSTNGSSATKTVSVKNGKINKKSGVISQCASRKVTVSNIKDFAEVLKNLNYTECLSYGVTSQDSVDINSAKNLRFGEIARTKENFFWPAGEAILFIDCDKPDVELDYLMQQLYKAEPFLETAPTLITRSTSHGLTDGKCEPTKGGYHVYFVIDSGLMIPKIGEAIYERLWANGQGYHSMNSSEDNPAILERCLIDKSVWQTNRIDYCASPVLVKPVTRIDSEFIILNENRHAFVTENFSTLTKTEIDAIRSIKEYSRSRLLPEVERRQEELLNEAPEEEKEYIQKRFSLLSENRLSINHELMLMDGSTVTIAQIQEYPEQYHMVTCCDPIEHDYRDYAEVAIIYTDEEMPVIHSMAHGGTTYHCEMAYELEVTVDFSAYLKKQDSAPKTVLKNKDGDEFKFLQIPKEITSFSGIVGKLIEWSLHNSKAPSYSISLASALQEVGTVIGRDYRTSMNNYSNLSITIVGDTGCGKEQLINNASDIHNAIKSMYPNAKNTMMGKVTSEGGMFTALEECPRRHMIIDEWGGYLQGVFSSRADAKKQEVVNMLTELYGRVSKFMSQTTYSQKGLKLEDRSTTPDVVHPFVSFTGVTNPADMTECVNEKMIRNGMINRHLFFFPREGIRETNLSINMPVPEAFRKWVEIINIRLAQSGSNGRDKYNEIERQIIINVPEEVKKAFSEFEREYKVRRSAELMNTPFYHLFPRVAENAMRIALIVELSDHPMATEITLASFNKATALVRFLKEEEIKYWELHLSVNEVEKHKKEVYSYIVEASQSGRTKTDLTKRFQKFTSNQKEEILKDLVDSGMIRAYNIASPSGKGAKKRMYYASKFLEEE